MVRFHGRGGISPVLDVRDMAEYRLTKGRGRTKLALLAQDMGSDLVIYIYNKNAHIGAVAVGEYDKEHQRASVSVLTRLGHKDDAIAQKAAHLISKSTKKPVCVISGVHLDNITEEEIDKILLNAETAVKDFISLKGIE